MSFVRYCKRVILGILGMMAKLVKNDTINLCKTLMFPAYKNSTASLTSFLRYHNVSYNFLSTLDRPGQTHKNHKKGCRNLQKILMFISMQKIFLGKLKRYCVVVILSSLNMPGCIHQI